MTVLLGATVTLRPATPADVVALATIRATPEVQERWAGGDDLTAEILDDLVDPELHLLVIDEADRIVGAI
jgi:aminoglycoside 6'-N-acetyltransferase